MFKKNQYCAVIKKIVLINGAIYENAVTSEEQIDGFIGIDRDRKGSQPLYISKSAILTLEFTGERW